MQRNQDTFPHWLQGDPNFIFLEGRYSLFVCSYILIIRLSEHVSTSPTRVCSSQSLTTDPKSVIPIADTVKRLNSEMHLQLESMCFYLKTDITDIHK